MTMELDSVHCMDALELLRSLDAQSVDAIITDLPYGTTACSWDSVIPFAPLWEAVKHALKPRGVFVTTASQPFTSALIMSNPKWFRYEWIWDKVQVTNVANARKMPLFTHEHVLVFAESLGIYIPQFRKNVAPSFGRKTATNAPTMGKLGINYQRGVGYPKTILRYMRPNNLTGGGFHPTQKPVALYAYLIRTYTQVGALVVDPFCGSGTTALACLKTGRHFIVGDSDPHYCEVTRQRLKHPSKDELKAALAGKPTTTPMFD